jgi:hypothetical protein
MTFFKKMAMYRTLIDVISLEKNVSHKIIKRNYFYYNVITVFIFGLGLFAYTYSELFFNYSYNILSHFFYFYFTLHTIMIMSNGISFQIIHVENYFPFPVRKKDIFFLKLYAILWDRNVILSPLLLTTIFIYSLNCDNSIKIILIVLMLATQLCYYIIIITTITLIPVHISKNKKVYLVYVISMIFMEIITRQSKAYFLWDIYPFSGWIGSAVMSAFHGSYMVTGIYFILVFLLIILCIFLCTNFMYPRRSYV